MVPPKQKFINSYANNRYEHWTLTSEAVYFTNALKSIKLPVNHNLWTYLKKSTENVYSSKLFMANNNQHSSNKFFFILKWAWMLSAETTNMIKFQNTKFLLKSSIKNETSFYNFLKIVSDSLTNIINFITKSTWWQTIQFVFYAVETKLTNMTAEHDATVFS